MSKQQFIEIDILDLIPQRPPFVMVDRLVWAGENRAESVFAVSSENIFVEGALFQESGLIENIAQTAAAFQGYRARAGREEIKNGYIGGIKNLEIKFLPSVGEQLKTVINEEHRVMGASVFTGESRVGERVVATCEFKVFIQ